MIFLSEFSVMLLLSEFPHLSRGTVAVIDSTILLLLLSPAYFLLFLPLKNYYYEHQCAHMEIRFLSRRLLTLSEEEKKGIARDLHDACGQTIAALQYKIGALNSTLPPDTSPERIGQFEQVKQIVHQLSNQVRNLIAQLRPLMLEHFGIVPTLEWLITEFAGQRQEIALTFSHDVQSERFSGETEIALFRVCQESLNNALRHGAATRADVILKRSGSMILLQITDDGCGFVPELVRGRKRRLDGIGLLGMRERVETLGGRLTINSAPGEGTTILAEIPREREVHERRHN